MTEHTFLTRVESHLDVPVAVKEQVLREFASHLAEIREELVEAGMNPVQAEIEAENRLGYPSDIAARLNAMHNSASWKSALLCAVPYIGSAVFLLLPTSNMRIIITALLMLVLGGSSIRELVLGRRPVWLAPWLAGALVSTYSIIETLCTNNAPRSLSIASLLLLVMTLASGWRISKWRIPIIAFGAPIIIGALYALSYQGSFDSMSMLPLLPMPLCGLALLFILARCVLEKHPYGSAVQASFLLLTCCTLTSHVPKNHSDIGILSISALICALVVVWLARTPTLSRKRSAFWTTLFAHSIATQLVRPDAASLPPIATAIGILISTSMLYWLVCTPIEMERLARPDRPSIAR